MDARLSEVIKNTQCNYVAPFMWLHNEDDAEFIRELRNIYDSGIHSICLESRTHGEFCREDWWTDVAAILEESSKIGMKVWILDDKHFPTGYANGIFEEKYKHLQPFGITEYHMDVAGPVSDGAAFSYWRRDKEDELLAVVALRHIPGTEKYDKVIDITDGFYDGMVYFDLPEGTWRIVFEVKTKHGIAQRFRQFCDMLNPDAVDLFIKEIYQPHYDRFSEYFGNTFLGFFSDEPGFQNNTNFMTDDFSPDMGEALTHYPWHDKLKDKFSFADLAGIWFDIEGVSDKIRYSYMDAITREYSNNFCHKVGNWCREHNVMYIGHIIEDNNIHAKTCRGPGHYFRALEGQDMSGVDVVLHQIVPGLTECSNAGYVAYKHMQNEFFNYYLAKLGSSQAHIDPGKKGRAMCEIFGAYGWAEGTKIMKYLMDHMLVRGINYYVPHAFSPKPDDDETPPNFYDSGKNPQYRFFVKSMEYLNRMCHMLSDGMHIPTCAILYDAENHWVKKDFLPLEKIAKKLYDNLLDYDIIPADCIEKIKDSSLNGEKYNLLIVPYAEAIPEEIINKLKKADIRIITVSNAEWDSPFENVLLSELVQYMDKQGFRDVSGDYTDKALKYYHYTRSGAHIYMFVNEDIHNVIDAKLRLSAFEGGSYIEYDGFENKACVKNSNDSTIDISVAPYHSLMIICGNAEMGEFEKYEPKSFVGEQVLYPTYKISIAERGSEEYKYYKTTDKLFNVTGRGELTHFSGNIKYETEIELSGKDWELELEYVGEAADVYLNGKLIGSKQFPPYRFEISKEDVADKNQLMIIVSNHNGYAVRDIFSSYLLFEASGLMGKTKLREIKKG